MSQISTVKKTNPKKTRQHRTQPQNSNTASQNQF